MGKTARNKKLRSLKAKSQANANDKSWYQILRQGVNKFFGYDRAAEDLAIDEFLQSAHADPTTQAVLQMRASGINPQDLLLNAQLYQSNLKRSKRSLKSADLDVENKTISYFEHNQDQYRLVQSAGQFFLQINNKFVQIQSTEVPQMAMIENEYVAIIHGKNNKEISMYNNQAILLDAKIIQDINGIKSIARCNTYGEGVCVVMQKPKGDFPGFLSSNEGKFAKQIKEERQLPQGADSKIAFDGGRIFWIQRQSDGSMMTNCAGCAFSYQITKNYDSVLGTPIFLERLEYQNIDNSALFFYDQSGIYYTSFDSNGDCTDVKKISGLERDLVSFQVVRQNGRTPSVIKGFDVYATYQDGRIEQISFGINLIDAAISTEPKLKCIENCGQTTTHASTTSRTTITSIPTSKTTASSTVTSTTDSTKTITTERTTQTATTDRSSSTSSALTTSSASTKSTRPIPSTTSATTDLPTTYAPSSANTTGITSGPKTSVVPITGGNVPAVVFVGGAAAALFFAALSLCLVCKCIAGRRKKDESVDSAEMSSLTIGTSATSYSSGASTEKASLQGVSSRCVIL